MHLNAILVVEDTAWAVHQREWLVFYRGGIEFACSIQSTNKKEGKRNKD